MKTQTILIVEDDAAYRKLLQRVFTEENFNVFVAEDGQVALECLERETIDIILSDIQMPRMDGHLFVYALKENIKYRSIPVIMITASISTREEVWSRGLGADVFLNKPVRYKELIRTVKKLLDARKTFKEEQE